MIVKGIVKSGQIVIPNYWNLKDGEVLIEVKLFKLGKNLEENELKETAEALIEHYEKEKRKEVPIDSEKVKKAAEKIGLKGISLEDLLNENF